MTPAARAAELADIAGGYAGLLAFLLDRLAWDGRQLVLRCDRVTLAAVRGNAEVLAARVTGPDAKRKGAGR